MTLTLGERVIGIDHIFDRIIHYADRRTLGRMMRLNKSFYVRVAKPLYHTVAVWEETFDSLLDGAHKGCSCDDCNQSLMDRYGFNPKTGETTAGLREVSKPHFHGKYTDPVVHDKSTIEISPKTKEQLEAERDAWIPPIHKHHKTPPRNVNKKGKGKKKQKKPAKLGDATTSSTSSPSAASSASSSSSAPDSPTPVTPNATCTAKPGTKGPIHKPRLKLPIPKTTLLSYVRVFTLGSHHESACDIYCNAVSKYLTNLEVLRVVQTPSHPYATFMLCENIPHGSCPILDSLKPPKLVVRNCGGGYLPFPHDWELADETKEVVVVLPTIHDRYSDLQLIKSYIGQFTKAEHLKIVFWPDWDMSLTHHRLARGMVDNWREEFKKPLRRHIPFHVDDISAVLKAFMKCRIYPEKHVFTTGLPDRPRVTVYGFGALKLSEYKEVTGRSAHVVERFTANNPNATVPDLHTLAKRNAISGEIGVASSGTGIKFMYGTCDEVQWKTIGNYTRNLHERKAEIDEYD